MPTCIARKTRAEVLLERERKKRLRLEQKILRLENKIKCRCMKIKNQKNHICLACLAFDIVIPYGASDHPPYALIAWWSTVFEFVGPSVKDHIELRFMCRLFSEALPIPPLFYIFPNPNDNINTLERLFERLESGRATQYFENNDCLFYTEEHYHLMVKRFHLFLKDGVYDQGGKNLIVPSHSTIVGESRDGTIICNAACTYVIEEGVVLKDMTIRKSMGTGIYVPVTGNCVMVNIKVDGAGGSGIVAHDATLIDVEVTNCYNNGVSVPSGSEESDSDQYRLETSIITIAGATKIHHNCKGNSRLDYGLSVTGNTAEIHLMQPLTKKKVSFHNKNGSNNVCRAMYTNSHRAIGNGNWNSEIAKNIHVVDKKGTILENADPDVEIVRVLSPFSLWWIDLWKIDRYTALYLLMWSWVVAELLLHMFTLRRVYLTYEIMGDVWMLMRLILRIQR